MKQRLKTFNYFWQEGLIERCLDNYKQWTSLPKVQISKYEDVVENIRMEVEQAQHLKININSDYCHQVAGEYTLELQKNRMEQFKEK